MVGIELDRPCAQLVNDAVEAGLLLSVTADSVVRLLPALIMSTTELDELVSILVPLIQKFLSK
jgi:acetylornithine aminotransferase